MMVVQIGLAGYTRHIAAGAAQDGAITAAAHGSDPAHGVTVARSLFDSAAAGLVTDSSVTNSVNGDTITITVSGSVVKVFPLFPTITFEAIGAANRERFIPEG